MLNSDTMELDLPLTHSETESGFSDCGGGPPEAGRGAGRRFSPRRASRRDQHCQHFDFRLLGSKTERE